MAGCNKKRRRPRFSDVAAHKETRQARHKKYGHSYTRSDRTTSWPQVKRQEGVTFEEEYKTYRKTRGRRGLSPNPDRRQPENPNYLNRNSVFATRRVPLTELMERAILAHENGGRVF